MCSRRAAQGAAHFLSVKSGQIGGRAADAARQQDRQEGPQTPGFRGLGLSYASAAARSRTDPWPLLRHVAPGYDDAVSDEGRPGKVRDLKCSMVISMPDTGLKPAIITGISEPMGVVRFIDVEDLETNEPNPSRFVLNVDRGVVVHDLTVEQHLYTNISPDVIKVKPGNQDIDVAPGQSVGYVGEAKPSVFPDHSWDHAAENVEVDNSAEDR